MEPISLLKADVYHDQLVTYLSECREEANKTLKAMKDLANVYAKMSCHIDNNSDKSDATFMILAATMKIIIGTHDYLSETIHIEEMRKSYQEFEKIIEINNPEVFFALNEMIVMNNNSGKR